MADAAEADIRFEAVTDLRAGLADADIVLSSFRPGGFEARHLDEAILLRHGLIGQETQGAGGYFVALRAIHALRPILGDMEPDHRVPFRSWFWPFLLKHLSKQIS